jgi:cardiolipin synthase
MEWPIDLIEIPLSLVYLTILGFTIVKILLDTSSTPKALAYLLAVIALPVAGIILYYSFGINYRHKGTTQKGKEASAQIVKEFSKLIPDRTSEIVAANDNIFRHFDELAMFLHSLGTEYMGKNTCQLLTNGEEKFPEVLKTLEDAKYFIHLEYYDWENDTRGNQIKEVLINKMKEGVKVRVLFDDFASKGIKKNIVKELRSAGAEIHPMIKVRLKQIANRLNHRDHRKLIIMDGHTAFIGGINISDRYDNTIDTGLYWRDTHVKLVGNTALSILKHFLINWNTAQDEVLAFDKDLVPNLNQIEQNGFENKGLYTQVIPGGPIYPMSNIMLTYFKIFTLARTKLYLTNPYFIPNESILDALKQAALSGVDVRIIVPKKSDSGVVGAASKFYYHELLQAGVRIFEYRKGFVHAKTVVVDELISVIGTANMDIRSFDLNFEMFSVIYDQKFAQDFEAVFLKDLEECDEVSWTDWQQIKFGRRLTYAVARLSSSFL